MDTIYALVLILAEILVAVFCRIKQKNLPPGPMGLPFIGNVLEMLSADQAGHLKKWRDQYGPTFSVRVGASLRVFMHDYDTIKKVYAQDNTTGRDHNFLLVQIFKGKGIVGADGPIWKEHRRFALSKLRDLGMGKTWMEEAILEEVNEVVNIFAAYGRRAFDARPHVSLAISNVICAMSWGKRFDHSDQKFQRLCMLFGECAVLMGKLLPVQDFPILKQLPGRFGTSWASVEAKVQEIVSFITELVKEHTKERDQQTDNPDYINYYLAKKAEQANNPDSTFDDEQLVASLFNLFVAGTETSASTLLWSFIYMAENPDVLAKVQAEIDIKVGRNRPVRMSDKAILPYTEAVIYEIHRLATVIVAGIPHTTFAPMQIDGFDIPAGTILMTNAFSIHRDPKYFKHPNRFYPEHFLDDKGALVVPKGFMPFSVGKRACLGENLAKMMFFLFFTNIVQKFDLEKSATWEADTRNVSSGFVRVPLSFQVSFIPH